MRPLRVIGTLRSCFREKFGTPRQARIARSSSASLRLRREFIPKHSLRGLEGFSHVWLISHFHLNTNKTYRPTVHPPRLRGKTMGLFATRSPHRPSPLGLTLAKLERIEGDTLRLSGIDLVDGTPILDIKPYLPNGDSAPGASAGWAGRKAFPRLKVAIPAPMKRRIALLEDSRPGLERLLREVLREDPRNHRDRLQASDGRVLGFFLFDLNILFRVDRGRATVLDLETGRRFKKETRGRQAGSGRRAPSIEGT